MEFSSYLLPYFDGHQKSKGFNGLGIDFQSLLFLNYSHITQNFIVHSF